MRWLNSLKEKRRQKQRNAQRNAMLNEVFQIRYEAAQVRDTIDTMKKKYGPQFRKNIAMTPVAALHARRKRLNTSQVAAVNKHAKLKIEAMNKELKALVTLVAQ
jgi:transcription termination factor NusB